MFRGVMSPLSTCISCNLCNLLPAFHLLIHVLIHLLIQIGISVC